MIYVIFVASIYMMVVAMASTTNNFKSFMIFRAIPFFLGLVMFIYSFKNLGWMNLF